LADRQGSALFIGTPKSKNNPLYDLFQFAKNPLNTDWAAFQYTTLEGGFVSESEIEAARQDMSEKQFKQEFLASFETDESQVAWAFNRDTHSVDLPAEIDTRTLFIGVDFNVSPICATIAVQNGQTLTIIDEIQMYSSNTDELAEEIVNRYPRSKIFVYPDPAGSQRKTSANGMTDHKILENRGFVVKAPRKHDPVRDRINATNARLRNAAGEINLYIGRSCKKTIESLEKHSFKVGTSIPDKDSGYDHMFDALSYMVAYLYPIRTQSVPAEPQRWGHQIA
jgi:hypothetical protein